MHASYSVVNEIYRISTLGFTTRDWFKTKLNHAEVLLALEEMAKFHACGLAYRMSLKVICV